MSKELEAFRDILGILCAVSGCEVDINSERVRIIKQALLKVQKLEKAIEIIREKDVNFDFLCSDTFSGYNSMMKYTYCYLTQEEFDLLKEVIK